MTEQEVVKEVPQDELIAQSVFNWINTAGENNPIYEIHKALAEGTITYREYLHKVGSVISHFTDTLGFVPNPNLVEIVNDKFYTDGTSSSVSSTVNNFTSSLRNLKSSDYDDYL